MTKTKRKRGGQKGNQNARKHGFYSSVLTPDQMSQLWNIVTKENVPPESAIMRLKLQSMLSQSTANTRTLKEAVRLIVRWSAQKYRLDRAGRVHMRAFIESAFQDYSGIPLCKPEKLRKAIAYLEDDWLKNQIRHGLALND
jgi:uncharacterized protein YjcR